MQGDDLATFAARTEKTVKTYFEAWQAHDLAALDRIFSDDATYAIDGKETFNSLAHIRSYWHRNATRQANVEIKYSCLVGSPASKSCQVRFLVKFDELFGSRVSASRLLRGVRGAVVVVGAAFLLRLVPSSVTDGTGSGSALSASAATGISTAASTSAVATAATLTMSLSIAESWRIF